MPIQRAKPTNISASQLNLADTFAFTGTVTGAGGGKVLQAITSVDSTQTTTTSGSYAGTGLSVTITPSSANSRILILSQSSLYLTAAYLLILTLQREISGGTTTNLAEVDASGFIQQNVNGSSGSTCPITYLDSPNTTSACTYSLLFRNNSTSNTSYSSINTATDTMTCIEIGA